LRAKLHTAGFLGDVRLALGIGTTDSGITLAALPEESPTQASVQALIL